jgi:hypothetical protein
MNNNRRHNNNRNRFQKNNNFKNRGNFGGGGRSADVEGENISPQQRRNFENKRDQHLAKAKELLAQGDRVEAENHFQHADHYFRMANLGLDRAQQNQRNFDNAQTEETNISEPPSFDEPPAEYPVDMMGRFPQQKPAADAEAAPTNDLAALPFMQVPIKES